MRFFSVRRITFALCCAGALLHLYTAAFDADGKLSAFLIGLVVWSCLPYAVSASFACTKPKRLQVLGLGAAAASLAGDGFMHYAVVTSSSSTAALGLLFMPLWNLVALGPAGALSAWIIAKVRARSRTDREQAPTTHPSDTAR